MAGGGGVVIFVTHLAEILAGSPSHHKINKQLLKVLKPISLIFMCESKTNKNSNTKAECVKKPSGLFHFNMLTLLFTNQVAHDEYGSLKQNLDFQQLHTSPRAG